MQANPYVFQTKSNTTIATDYTAGGTSLVLTDSSDYGSTGMGWVKTARSAIEFVTWTANAANTLTISALSIDHDTGERFETLYALPSDYAKARQLLINTGEYAYAKQEYLPAYGTYYTRGSYIVLPESIGTQDGTLWYEKAATDLSSGNNETDNAKSLDIPEDFMWFAVHRLAAHIHGTRRRPDLEDRVLAKAEMELDRALNYDAQKTTPQGIYVDF